MLKMHKRIAIVNISIFGRMTPATMGLEVMNKVNGPDNG